MGAARLLVLSALLCALPGGLQARVVLQAPRAASHHYQFGSDSKGSGFQLEIELLPDDD